MALWLIAGLAALLGLAALTVWGASALWVRIISQRWDAMCAEDEPPRS